ncbi:unnamed protein product, partial [Didymodactylos carnosus]
DIYEAPPPCKICEYLFLGTCPAGHTTVDLDNDTVCICPSDHSSIPERPFCKRIEVEPMKSSSSATLPVIFGVISGLLLVISVGMGVCFINQKRRASATKKQNYKPTLSIPRATLPTLVKTASLDDVGLINIERSNDGTSNDRSHDAFSDFGEIDSITDLIDTMIVNDDLADDFAEAINPNFIIPQTTMTPTSDCFR